MKVALLCDVDQTIYHVGDEAIATASTARLRERGHQVVRLSRQEKFGPGGAHAGEDTIPALTVPWPLEDRARYLDEIARVLAGEAGALPPGDKLFAIRERLAEVDALVIGGGGSLTSRYGWLLDERLATARVAHALGTRIVLSGQSLGPELTDADREGVRELLDLCSLVGLRDARSVALARALAPEHPAIHLVPDDAVGLDLPGPELPGPELHGPARPAGERPVIAVTLAADPDPFPREDLLRVLAAVVDALAARTGAVVELVPHMADPEQGGADEALHAELAVRLAAPATAHPIEPDALAAARSARADWVVTTRFHPVVFGLLGGAGVLALPLNRYGAQRMDGALRAVGLAEGTVPLAALWDPVTGGPASAAVEPMVDALLAGRAAEREHLAAAVPALRATSAAWWDRVVAVLEGAEDTGEPMPEPAVQPRGFAVPGLAAYRAPAPDAADGAKAPAVAVVMRTRDRLRLLDRALQDVLAQTRQDWELVVVDDGGDAAAVELVLDRHRAEAGGRLRVIHRETSHGMEAASNAGLAATTAPVVAVHDDDDTWHATFLQETLAHLDAHPEQEAVVVRTLIVHERETPTGLVEEEVFPSWPELAGVRLLDYLAVNRHVPIAMAYRRRVHEAVGPFDESLPVVGDYAFHLALLRHGEVGFLDRPLAQWRQRPAAVGASANSMTAQDAGHRHYDAVLRERALQDWVAQNGLGLPMFVAKTTETQLAGTEERLLAELRGMRAELADTREELGAVRAELDEVRTRVRRLDPFSLGGRALRRLRGGAAPSDAAPSD